jgi:uncharacterized protein (DUF302 family)
MSYHLSKKISASFEEAIERVTEELRNEGFGTITSIDLKEIFQKKINQVFRNYVILGACNPRYAYEALLAENKIGVFLPCNVVIQQHENGDVEVSIINPEELMHGIDNLNLKTFGTEIKEAMQTVLSRL